ncbi:MAG: hypothetical protein H7Y31_16915 [Chitinophagaceae bacterium]|nr:hypothetical protein [Chitinophagaceae bacterium]
MMKVFTLAAVIAFSSFLHAQSPRQVFVATDIDNFWTAYQKIVSTKDTIKQYTYLKELYLDKASPGLTSLMEVRNYRAKDFLDAINQYPEFWSTLKPLTLNVRKDYPEIEAAFNKLRQLYPELKPATIYFAIGAFRTNGTIQGDRILIGSELALADNSVKINELPEWRQPFYREYSPRSNLPLLCTHEFIHTQQKDFVDNLLSTCLYEGIAEFLSCKATGKESNSPAIAFGKKNLDMVVKKYVEDLYLVTNNTNWRWGQNNNELKVRDLGYFIGYEIAERFYNSSADKAKAIKLLIELDYTNESIVEQVVDGSKLFPKPIGQLFAEYEKSRPTASVLSPFVNLSETVKPGLTRITVAFSEPLNGHSTSIDFGPLGENFFPRITAERTWSADARSWTFEADLQPNRHYQILISNNFRTSKGIRLKPYLIDFKTAN